MNDLVTQCEACKGYCHVLDGNWIVPHFTRGVRKVCRGSSRRVRAEVFTYAELKHRVATGKIEMPK